jgi:glutathione-regulated potassium-efflux system protein KefB
LTEIAVLLAALALAAPLARWLRIAAVLGYLSAGVLIGPFGLGSLVMGQDPKQLLHIAEFGVVLLLFLIGLELRPRRLWAMRQAIFGLGAAQVVISALVLGAMAMFFGFRWQPALFAGAALALSSTAFALQVMEETGELSARHGRLAFAVLLFQDLAAIPLIALTPFFAASAAANVESFSVAEFVRGLVTIAGVVAAGYFGLDPLLQLVARSRVKEAMTAAALLTVVGVTLIMQQAGLPAPLGAFIAGALLAESSYRHQLEADIAPFEGLLLGMFFTAIGMSLNLGLVLAEPRIIILLTFALMIIKAVILYGLGRWQGLEAGPARRLGLALSQGGEFAFVLLSVGTEAYVLGRKSADLLAVIITLSMALTPLLLALERRIFGKPAEPARAFDALPDNDAHVVIAGFGRFGQIIARILRAKGIPFMALDKSAEQIESVRKFGSKAFYGDASRPEILQAAQIGKARAFVLAIDDVEASLQIGAYVRENYPNVPVYARARDRNHAHRLIDIGIKNLRRETFLSALDLSRQLLTTGLGFSERVADRAVQTFRVHDERRLFEDYALFTDTEKLQQKAKSDAATLEQLFREDAVEEAKLAKADKEAKSKEKAR